MGVRLQIPGRIGVIRIGVNQAELGVMLYGTQGEVAQDIQRRAYAVQKRMKRLAPVWSGTLRDSIRVESVRESSKGPISKVYSDAPHAIVAEVGRGPVVASGAAAPSERRSRNTGPAGPLGSTKRFTGWDSPRPGGDAPLALTVRLNPGGGFYFAERVGPAAGARYMLGSVDAALD